MSSTEKKETVANEKKLSRRSYLKYAGAGIVVVAAAAAGGAYYYSTMPAAPSTPTQTLTQSSATATTMASATTTGQAYAGVNLNLGSIAEPFLNGITAHKNEFTAMTGATLTIETIEYTALHDKAIMDVSAPSSYYDIWAIDGAWAQEFAPFAYSLNDWMARDEDRFQKADFYRHALDLCTLNGEITGFSAYLADCWHWTRTDILADAGVDYPQNLDQVFALFDKLGMKPNHTGVANKITGKNDLYGFTIGGALGGPCIFDWLYFWNAQGGNWLDPVTGKLAVNDDDAVACLENWKKLWGYGPLGEETFQWADKAAMFDTGKTVFVQGVTQEHANTIVDPSCPVNGKAQNEIMFQNPDPNSPCRKAGILRGGTGLGWTWFIPKNSKNKEAAWEFLLWEMSKANQLAWGEYTSPRKSVLEDPTLAGGIYKFITDKNAADREYGTIGPPDPGYPKPELGAGAIRIRYPYGSRFYDTMEPLIQAFLLEKRTAKDALDEAYKELVAIEPELAK